MHNVFQKEVNQKDPRLAAMRLRLDIRDVPSALPAGCSPARAV